MASRNTIKSYGVIKEALLVNKNGPTDEYYIVQKLVPATVNAVVILDQDGGFESNGRKVTVSSVYHGGAFGFSEGSNARIQLVVNIPGYGVKTFDGSTRIEIVNGVGNCVMCTPVDSGPSTPYTNLCLVVESPGSVFAEI